MKPRLLTLVLQLETTEPDLSKVVSRVEREMRLQFGKDVVVFMGGDSPLEDDCV